STEQTSEVADSLPGGFFSMRPGAGALFQHGDIAGLVPQLIEVERHTGFERLIMSFLRIEGTSGSGQIELWVEPVAEARADGSSAPMPMEGDFLLAISMPGTSPRLEGPLPDVATLEDGVIEDVAYTGFEGGGTLYIGLTAAEAEYRLSTASDPYQVVIDVRLPS